MTVLTKKQLLMLHSQLIAETGGVDGLRDEGMLESAMNAPFQSFAGEYLTATSGPAHTPCWSFSP